MAKAEVTMRMSVNDYKVVERALEFYLQNQDAVGRAADTDRSVREAARRERLEAERVLKQMRGEA